MGSTSLGQILVDSHGATLYLFASDSATTSTCTGVCASSWPPATVSGTPTVGAGLSPSLVSTLVRPDGTKQLVYHGHPLYTYLGDSAPGQTNGEGNTSFGAGWFVLDASGNQK